jgi:hypothetical protein
MNRVRFLLTIIVLQALVIAAQWMGGSGITRAYGQIPDAGGQRAQMIDELKSLNSKMDKLMGILEGGKLQVRVVPPDERK